MSSERWARIPDAPQHEVSDLGRIRSFRKDPQGRLSKLTSRRGYMVVRVYTAAGWRLRPVHQLVLEAFVGARPEGATDARHLNDVKDDNRLENLRWGSRSENMRDTVANGIHHYSRRSACKNGHEFTPISSYVKHRLDGTKLRVCRTCNTESKRAAKARRKAAASISERPTPDYAANLAANWRD